MLFILSYRTCFQLIKTQKQEQIFLQAATYNHPYFPQNTDFISPHFSSLKSRDNAEIYRSVYLVRISKLCKLTYLIRLY